MTLYCGVDFGTSNSTVAAIGKDGPLLIPLEEFIHHHPHGPVFPL